jgi:hypothetical protein
MIEGKLKKSDIRKINKKLLESLQNYRKMVAFMGADVPIGVLCLPRTTEKILANQGFLRVYDLLDVDFAEIKGIGDSRSRDITSSLNKFFSMS